MIHELDIGLNQVLLLLLAQLVVILFRKLQKVLHSLLLKGIIVGRKNKSYIAAGDPAFIVMANPCILQKKCVHVKPIVLSCASTINFAQKLNQTYNYHFKFKVNFDDTKRSSLLLLTLHTMESIQQSFVILKDNVITMHSETE